MQSLPYIAQESVINSFGTLVDILGDENYVYYAHQRSKCHTEINRVPLGIN